MYEFPCRGPITVDLRLAAGTIELYAEARDTATVQVEPYEDGDAAREAADRTRVELSGDTLLIDAPESSSWLWRRAPRLRITARVPTGSSARLRAASADTSCHGEWAQVKLNTASGDASFTHVTGDLTVNTASGDVRVDRVGGQFTVKTASGDVSARHVNGSVDVKGASGDLRIDELGEDLSVTTASGDVNVGAARRGSLRTNTATGDVTIGVVSGTGVWLDLNTLSGRTESDLNMGDDSAATNHALTLQVRTVSGNIRIHRVTLPATT